VALLQTTARKYSLFHSYLFCRYHFLMNKEIYIFPPEGCYVEGLWKIAIFDQHLALSKNNTIPHSNEKPSQSIYTKSMLVITLSQALRGVCYYVSGISFASQEHWIIWMKFEKGNHPQINWLRFGRNCTRDKGAGYDRKFESTSSTCCRVANDFAYMQLQRDDMISRDL